MFTSEL